jgi:hypothetical protein
VAAVPGVQNDRLNLAHVWDSVRPHERLMVLATSVRVTNDFPSCSITGKHNQLRAPLMIASLLPLTNSSGRSAVFACIFAPEGTTSADKP